MRHLFEKAFCCVICASFIAVLICLLGCNNEIGYITRSYYIDKEQETDNTPEKTQEHTKKKEKNLTKKCRKLYKNNPELLVLVNKDNPLKEDYDAGLMYICNGRLQASSKLYNHLVEMLADAAKEGYQYWIASAYRNRQKQQSLIDEDVRKLMNSGMSYESALAEVYKETMPAGCSEHETGLALDILCSGNTNMDSSQENEPGNKWLKENCYKYGFILRYPSDKSNITGVNYEPWHFRYVGKKAAALIMKNNLTLEEFFF